MLIIKALQVCYLVLRGPDKAAHPAGLYSYVLVRSNGVHTVIEENLKHFIHRPPGIYVESSYGVKMTYRSTGVPVPGTSTIFTS
jgi:hypothetical protein